MLRLLFPRLTAGPARGAELFDWVTEQARDERWYIAGGVPDTINGRFAMLATLAALVLVRLERQGEAGDALAVALTERFVEAMEAEHRELGLGDPTLGKTVRKLVGSLARRVELWRGTVGGGDWEAASVQSLFDDAGGPPDGTASAALREYWQRLESAPLSAIAEGRVE